MKSSTIRLAGQATRAKGMILQEKFSPEMWREYATYRPKHRRDYCTEVG